MPKVSKVSTKPGSVTNSRPQTAANAALVRKEFYCCRCGQPYKKQKGYFAHTHSPLYEGNDGYVPICNECLDKLLQHYAIAFGSEEEAVERICLKFDIYWNPDIYAMVVRENKSGNHIRAYISKTNLVNYRGKSYDDTLDEQFYNKVTIGDQSEDESVEDGQKTEIIMPKDKPQIERLDQSIIDFWGAGFDVPFYLELDRKYRNWTEGLAQPPDKGEEAIYKQVCILEATINRDSAAGKPIEKNVNALNSLLGSANLRPNQKKDETDVAFDNMSFGQGIRMFENSRPIPQPDPEMRDVDGIVRYISIWFLGHLCKMLNIKNTYCKMYEEEIEKMRIENPEMEEEDDETLFNNIFGDDT